MLLSNILITGLVAMPDEREGPISMVIEWADSIMASRYSYLTVPIIACLTLEEEHVFRKLIAYRYGSIVEYSSELLNYSIDELNLRQEQKEELLREKVLIVKKYNDSAE